MSRLSRLRYLGAAQAYARGRAIGACPCRLPVDDPGPRHIPQCPYADEDYDGHTELRLIDGGAS